MDDTVQELYIRVIHPDNTFLAYILGRLDSCRARGYNEAEAIGNLWLRFGDQLIADIQQDAPQPEHNVLDKENSYGDRTL